jgi:3',5'-cyclic AMP phosphodiesterase CpdA
VPILEIATLDAILGAHSSALGSDATPYRNHAYRVANLSLARAPRGADALEKIAIAAACHDLGIWTDRTFDYLAPSVRLATAWLAGCGRSAWTPEIVEMIDCHHKITPFRGRADWLVEVFRQADWVDVTRGVLTFGTSRSFIAELYSAWPSAGFHKRLLQLELGHLRKHPFNPLPVFRL